MQKTYMQKTAEVERNWHLVDADGQILGRLATQIATKLMGKNKPTYTPHIDGGEFVVVINASKIAVTGKKETDKEYFRYSGYPGGLRSLPLGKLRDTYPTRIIEAAVYNMLPDNRLRSGRMGRLKIYADANHKHESQLKK
jgi:large subunit ribosomal protein L13